MVEVPQVELIARIGIPVVVPTAQFSTDAVLEVQKETRGESVPSSQRHKQYPQRILLRFPTWDEVRRVGSLGPRYFRVCSPEGTSMDTSKSTPFILSVSLEFDLPTLFFANPCAAFMRWTLKKCFCERGLRGIIVQSVLWKTMPKLNLLHHICEWQVPSVGNPVFCWAYADEDLEGLMIEVAHLVSLLHTWSVSHSIQCSMAKSLRHNLKKQTQVVWFLRHRWET